MCQDRWVRLRPALSLIAALTAVITALAPTASALPDRVAPIGHIGETLHFDYGTIGADVTVHNIEPTGVPAGMATRAASSGRHTSPSGLPKCPMHTRC